ncbi:hypothetical protein B0H19DRAFT_1104882 [Mycena capillaripes]|nr:hypothetical protein B0H19DRAFT_1104882 [Mycena capillaripes]
MSPAQDTVLLTPELLELVLTHVPMRDLLVTASRVSKTWRALTLAPTLQRILFFQPDPSASSETTQNPLLVELFPPFFIPELMARDSERWEEGDWPDANAIKAMPWSRAPDAFRRREASWRRMLVAQPPARTMGVIERCHDRGGDSERRGVLRVATELDSEGGLRMGVLYDIVLPLINRTDSSFCIRWHSDTGLDESQEQEEEKGGLTLTAIFTAACIRGRPGPFRDQLFYSEGAKSVEIEFGKWE